MRGPCAPSRVKRRRKSPFRRMSASRSARRWKSTALERAVRSAARLDPGKRLGAPHRPGAVVVLHRDRGADLVLVDIGDLAPGTGDCHRLELHPGAELEVDAA